MRADVRCVRAKKDTVAVQSVTRSRHAVSSVSHTKDNLMNSIIYIVGLVVIVLFIAGFFGLR
jgi:hypothetical protein